jgi:hypothetical protein
VVREQAERLMEQEVDGRLRIWIAVKLAGRPMSELARELGYADGSGVLRVVQRLEAAAREDRELAEHLRKLQARFELSSVDPAQPLRRRSGTIEEVIVGRRDADVPA